MTVTTDIEPQRLYELRQFAIQLAELLNEEPEEELDHLHILDCLGIMGVTLMQSDVNEASTAFILLCATE